LIDASGKPGKSGFLEYTRRSIRQLNRFEPFSDVAVRPKRTAFRLAEKDGETNFLFLSSRRPLIDAVLTSGLASRQIR